MTEVLRDDLDWWWDEVREAAQDLHGVLSVLSAGLLGFDKLDPDYMPKRAAWCFDTAKRALDRYRPVIDKLYEMAVDSASDAEREGRVLASGERTGVRVVQPRPFSIIDGPQAGPNIIDAQEVIDRAAVPDAGKDWPPPRLHGHGQPNGQYQHSHVMGGDTHTHEPGDSWYPMPEFATNTSVPKATEADVLRAELERALRFAERWRRVADGLAKATKELVNAWGGSGGTSAYAALKLYDEANSVPSAPEELS